MSLARATEASTGTGTIQVTSASGLANDRAGSSRQRLTSSCAALIRSSIEQPLTGNSNLAMVTALDALPSLLALRRLIGRLKRSRRVGRPCRSWYLATPVTTEPRNTSLTVSPRFFAAERICSKGNSNVANRYMVDREPIRGDNAESGIEAKRPNDSAMLTASDHVATGFLTLPMASSAITLAPEIAASATRLMLSVMFARLIVVTETSCPVGGGGALGSSGLPSGVSSNRLAAIRIVPCPSATA